MSSPTVSTPRGGPRTKAGKAIVRKNAIKHGILSNIVPEHERTDYAEHVTAIHAAYAPVGYLEEALAERISTSLWRLGRVARYETSTIERGTRDALHNLHSPDHFSLTVKSFSSKPPQWPVDMQATLDLISAGLTVHKEGPDKLKKAKAPKLHTWVTAAGMYSYEQRDSEEHYAAMATVDEMHGLTEDEFGWLGIEDEGGPAVAWTFEQAREAVQILMGSEHQKITLPDDWEAITDWLDWATRMLTGKIERVKEQHIQIQAQQALPTGEVTQKVARYEAHLERTLYRAMHELEAMQERRAGGSTPLARVEVHSEVHSSE